MGVRLPYQFCDPCDCCGLGVQILSDLDVVHVSSKKMCLPFEYTQNKQQYDTKITCTEVRNKVMEIIKRNRDFLGHDP